MIRGLTRHLGRTDWGILIIVMALAIIGLVMVYSASFHFSVMGWQDVPGPTYYFMRQLRFLGIGLLGLLCGWAIDYRFYKRMAIPILAATMTILIVMAIVGRWLQIIRGETNPNVVIYGSIQPVEAAKIGAIIYIALWLESKAKMLHSFSMSTWPFMFLLGIMVGLIALQPDLSTAILLVATATSMFFVAGAEMKQFLALITAGTFMVTIPILLGYGRERLETWLAGPFSDPLGQGYQMIQSLQALSAGGFLGLGLGQSQQKMYLGRVPHTDFIFAIIAEELGFVGAVAVIGLYGLFLWRGLRIAKNTPDIYGRLLAVGIVSWIAFQAILSIAVATNSAPVTGTVLPFISYGGSSLVSNLTSIGILLNISRGGSSRRQGGAR